MSPSSHLESCDYHRNTYSSDYSLDVAASFDGKCAGVRLGGQLNLACDRCLASGVVYHWLLPIKHGVHFLPAFQQSEVLGNAYVGQVAILVPDHVLVKLAQSEHEALCLLWHSQCAVVGQDDLINEGSSIVQEAIRDGVSDVVEERLFDWLKRVVASLIQQHRTQLTAAISKSLSADLLCRYIESVRNQGVCVGKMAMHFGYSIYHFSRVFKKLMGVSPHRFLLRVRLVETRLRLAQKNQHSICDLAYDLGFSDHSHLSRTFREGYGISPSDYQKVIRG